MSKGKKGKALIMGSPHSARVAQIVGVVLTFIIEGLFSFLAGWAMFDEFQSWGFWPGVIVGALSGLVFFLLGLYVFILREYAIDANTIFAKMRGQSVGWRLAWAVFLVVLVILIESFINANRMTVLPIRDAGAKAFLWLCFQALVFVPLALGKLVHGHVNATDAAMEERKFYNNLDSAFYQGVNKQLPNMSLGEIAQLRQGNVKPLQTRIIDEQHQIEAKKQGEAPHPLADGLRTFQPGETQSQNGRRN
jgi:hypothetical protein